jgi:RNA polymerase sigma-70 factor (ECF subfamily)
VTSEQSTPPGANPAAFVTTQWTRVMASRGDSPEAAAALGDLCAAYYAPVLAFIRRSGRNEDAARDLTQEFFARLLARHGLDSVDPGRGRFRSFLLGAVKHFLADQHDRDCAAKRGGGLENLSLETGTDTDTPTNLQIPDPGATVPDAFFDRQWALTVVGRAINALAAEFKTAGRSDQFEAIKPWLLGEVEGLSQAETARHLEMSENALKVAIHRLRKRFRALVKSEIAQTVGSGVGVQDELRYLLEVLTS